LSNFFLDDIFEAHLSDNRFDLVTENRGLRLQNSDLRSGYCSLVEECDRMADKIIALEFERDQLTDNNSTLNERVEYWRKEFRKLKSLHSKLKRKHNNCSSKNIILYR
jgi:hypothetical protein